MHSFYEVVIPRLNGRDIRRDFKYYRRLVKKGVAGFIVFGGELEEVRSYIQRLQDEAAMPLIIASDLERGLGQQLKGGTHFPPAMALAKAFRNIEAQGKRGLPVIRRSFRALAEEAAYAGINTIFAPVLDINTNPKNPIIAARAFGEDRDTVSFFGCEMIRTLQRCGIAACGKHFPGHGDTETDSHISLPSINRGIRSLRANELSPFKDAIAAGVKMIMAGHLKVAAIDASGLPMSLSGKAVGLLRDEMKFKGIIITDAMNMGGLAGFSEAEASLTALESGVDLILHPSDADGLVADMSKHCATADTSGIEDFRGRLKRSPLSCFSSAGRPDFDGHARLSERLTREAISFSRKVGIRRKPFLVVLNDDEPADKGKVFIERLSSLNGLKAITIGRGSRLRKIAVPEDAFVITAIFSETKAWKGGAGSLLWERVSYLDAKTDLFVSFGSPYLLDGLRGPKMCVYWDSAFAQEAAADAIIERSGRVF